MAEAKDGQENAGLVCPKCGCGHFYTVNTYNLVGAVRRRRECRNCGTLIRTVEMQDSRGAVATYSNIPNGAPVDAGHDAAGPGKSSRGNRGPNR